MNGLPPGVRATFRAGPGTKLSVLAFVGIGFSVGPLSAKVGIAGQVNLIDIAVPLGHPVTYAVPSASDSAEASASLGIPPQFRSRPALVEPDDGEP